MDKLTPQKIRSLKEDFIDLSTFPARIAGIPKKQQRVFKSGLTALLRRRKIEVSLNPWLTQQIGEL